MQKTKPCFSRGVKSTKSMDFVFYGRGSPWSFATPFLNNVSLSLSLSLSSLISSLSHLASSQPISWWLPLSINSLITCLCSSSKKKPPLLIPSISYQTPISLSLSLCLSHRHNSLVLLKGKDNKMSHILHNIVDAISGNHQHEEAKGIRSKIKGTVVLMKKNVLDFNDFHAGFLDRVHEFLGKRVSFQLVSSTVGDPSESLSLSLPSSYLLSFLFIFFKIIQHFG